MAFPPVPFQEWFLRQTSTGNAALNAYVARVKADGGIVEAIGCVPQAVWDWAAPSFVGLLDLYPNAAAAYSLRKLRAAYSGSAVRVRKEVSSVSSETDIGFLADGSLDTTSLLAFASDADSGDVFVVTWYDQSLSNDATQSTAANQPKIVSSGSLVTENGKVAIDFDGTNDGLKSAAINTSFTNVSCFIVKKNEATSGVRSVVRIRPNGTVGTLDGISYEQIGGGQAYGPNTLFEANGNAIQNTSGQGSSVVVQELSTLLFEQSQILAYRDGSLDQTINNVSTGTAPIGTCSVNQPLWIGYNFDSNDRAFDGKFQEIILFTSDQSANRTGIETNINNFYSIYP